MQRLDFIWLAGSAFDNRQTGWVVVLMGANREPRYTMRFVRPRRTKIRIRSVFITGSAKGNLLWSLMIDTSVSIDSTHISRRNVSLRFLRRNSGHSQE